MSYNGVKYGADINGANATMSPEIQNFYYQKQALIDAKRQQYFMPLADVTSMPKNFGKKIRRYHYLPLVDDRNINDQGIDANGQVISNGNLYGSSKDVGTITSKLPVLSESGGRVNRVGFKRIEVDGTFEKFGFFDEFTKESLDFDSDADLMMHINRETLNGASQITEAALQADLLNSAGAVRYPGAAVSNATVDGTSIVTYSDLLHLSIDLDNNRTPKQTTWITGTRLIDTKTVPSARVMYMGTELLPTVKAMKDLHGNPAFIPVERYASGTTTFNGEVGAIDQFRLVVVPLMQKWAGAGANAGTDATCYETNGHYDVFPMLCIGEESFTTIGFQTDGKTVKFKIITKMPGEETATSFNDPYGEIGFMSIKWYYGFMCLRPERIGLIKTAAKL